MLTLPAEKILGLLSDPSEEFAVIVEGKKDSEALKRLGIIRTEILNKYRGIIDMADALAEKGVRRAVILTDYDRAGKRLARMLRLALQSAGIFVDWRLRAELRRVFNVTYIEGLHRGSRGEDSWERFTLIR